MKNFTCFNLNKPIYFYFVEDTFSHLSICLAEGFQELGVPFYSNINYWKLSEGEEDYLFHQNKNITPDDCSIVICDTKWMSYKPDLPENLFHSSREYITVYLDDMDGLTMWNPGLEKFDLRFRTHYNHQSKYPPNCVPWVFGLSNRILKQTENFIPFKHRQSSLLFNFRINQKEVISTKSLLKFEGGFLLMNSGSLFFDNPVRLMAQNKIVPVLEKIFTIDDRIEELEIYPTDSYNFLQWQQTGRRHHPKYYQRLKESAASACFAGCLIPLNNLGESFVDWWDSWRFWESLASRCVTFHVDFDKYGIHLPVMPENWRHYIGIDLDNPQATIDRIIDEPNILERVSTEGYQWAVDHYSPVPTALRFLNIISAYKNEKQGSFKLSSPPLNLNVNLSLKKINLVIFPDWSKIQSGLSLALKKILQTLGNRSDTQDITLLLDNRNKADEEANLILSSVLMELLIAEEITLDEPHLEIVLLGQENSNQWSVLFPQLSGRIQLEYEDQNAIIESKAHQLPCYSPEQLDKIQF